MQDKQKVYDQAVRDAFQEYERSAAFLWKKYLRKCEQAKEILNMEEKDAIVDKS